MYSALVTYAVQVTLTLLSNQTMYEYNLRVLCVCGLTIRIIYTISYTAVFLG